MLDQEPSLEEFTSVQRAFNKQAEHYDEDDLSNHILVEWRHQVYHHINLFIKPNSHILELNAGTGIDALQFVRSGHSVHATDTASGMVQKIQQKIDQFSLRDKLSSQKCSFESLNMVKGKKFDYVFSNFGGLNCCKDLTRVTKDLPALLNRGAYVTWVIMPPVCLWELLRIFKGKKAAFRRFQKKGAIAHLEGEYFMTHYYSLSDLKKDFGPNFRFLKTEGLGAVSPPPSSLNFTLKHPWVYSFLKKVDRLVSPSFPFNRWADHIIVTFQFNGNENLR